MSCLGVNPAVNAALIEAAKDEQAADILMARVVQNNLAGNNCFIKENQVLWSNYELRAYIMFDKVFPFDQTSGSMRAFY